VKERTVGRGAPRGNPSARTQLFAADRRTSHGSMIDLLGFLTSSLGFHSTPVRNTRGFTGGWTMGPSAAWFYEGQLRLHRNWKLECVLCATAVSGHRVDGGRSGYRLFLVLPRSQELAYHGVLQEPHTAGIDRETAPHRRYVHLAPVTAGGISLHLMHETQAIGNNIGRVCTSVSLSVCLSVTWLPCVR